MEEKGLNFGFRRNYSTHHALHRIKKLSPACEIAIEGDIEGAYDNINHQILLKILEKNINDRDFLKIIKQGLRSGLIEFGKYKDTLLGTPQGGIASPILFNIYMHEFDTYIQEGLQNYINQYNIDNKRVHKPMDKSYRVIEGKIYRLRKQYKKLKTNENGEKIKY